MVRKINSVTLNELYFTICFHQLYDTILSAAKKSKEELENEEMEKFTELYTQWKGQERTSETYKTIPRFFFKVCFMQSNICKSYC